MLNQCQEKFENKTELSAEEKEEIGNKAEIDYQNGILKMRHLGERTLRLRYWSGFGLRNLECARR